MISFVPIFFFWWQLYWRLHLPNLIFPPPLILSVRGDVKLFDFGLARGKEEM